MPETGGGELEGGLEQALGEHGEDAVAVARGLAVEQGGELELAEGFDEEFDMAVREGADDGEDLVGADEGFVPEQPAEGVDLGGGLGGDVRRGCACGPWDLRVSLRGGGRREGSCD